MVFVPMFSPFMFGCQKKDGKRVLALSKWWTFVNILVTIVGAIGGMVVMHIVEKRWLNESLELQEHFSTLSKWDFWIECAIFLIPLIVTLILILPLFYKWARCPCCSQKLERSGVCLDNIEETLDFDTPPDEVDIDVEKEEPKVELNLKSQESEPQQNDPLLLQENSK